MRTETITRRDLILRDQEAIVKAFALAALAAWLIGVDADTLQEEWR